MQAPVENKALGLTPRQQKQETPSERADREAAEEIASHLADDE